MGMVTENGKGNHKQPDKHPVQVLVLEDGTESGGCGV